MVDLDYTFRDGNVTAGGVGLVPCQELVELLLDELLVDLEELLDDSGSPYEVIEPSPSTSVVVPPPQPPDAWS